MTPTVSTQSALNTGAGSRSKGDLLIGFAFSRWPDGSPGRCNEQIAKSMRADLVGVPAGDRPAVGVQWEIFDALQDLDTRNLRAVQCVADHAIVGPPRVERVDILDGDALLRLLREASLPALRRLAGALGPGLEVATPDAAALCRTLNALLEDPHLFERFDRFVELGDVDRRAANPALSFLGVEKRKLPATGAHPRGLRRFQAAHVNRLLIEALVPEPILARGRSATTRQAIDVILDTVDLHEIGTVWVYAHPGHRGWCRQQTPAALGDRGWAHGADRVQYGGPAEWDQNYAWDADTAQVWCRSAENWDAYLRLNDMPS